MNTLHLSYDDINHAALVQQSLRFPPESVLIVLIVAERVLCGSCGSLSVPLYLLLTPTPQHEDLHSHH